MKPKQLVTILVKSVSAPKKVSNRDGREFQTQDCVVGDISGCGKVVSWEEKVGTLTEGNCYKLTGASVKLFGGVSYPSVGENCRITEVDDIGQVADIEGKESGKVVEGELMQSCAVKSMMVVRPRSTVMITLLEHAHTDEIEHVLQIGQIAITTKDQVHWLTLFHEDKNSGNLA